MKKTKTLLMGLVFIFLIVLSCCSKAIDLTLDANGGTFANGESTYVIKTNGKQPVTIPELPTREKYIFMGWYLDKEGTQSAAELLSRELPESVTVYARWRPEDTYIVTFNTRGGSQIAELWVKEGETFTLPDDPARTGYTFNGWYLDETCQDSAESKLGEPVTEDYTVYAGWTANKYTITLNVNGGNPLEANTAEVTYDQGYTLPVSQRTGHTFLGWYNAAANGTKYADNEGKSIANWTGTSDITLYAVWSKNSYTLTLTKNINAAGTVSGGGSKDYDSAITITATTKAGYTWLGWYDGATRISSNETYTFRMPDQNKTYQARWEVNKYTLKFDKNKPEGAPFNVEGEMQDLECTYDEAKALPANAYTLAGYTFAGWTENADGSGELYDDEEEIINLATGGTMTLYAKWNINSYTLTLTKNINAAGDVSGSGSKVFNSEIMIVATTNPGYTWVGWYYEDSLISDKATFTGNMPCFDKTIEARWQPNSYSVTLTQNIDYAGSVSGEGSKEYNSEVTLTATTNAGYTWIGWYEDNELVEDDENYTFTMGAGDKAIEARWKVNNYTVKFDKNKPQGTDKEVAGEMQDLQCTYTQESVLPKCTYTLEDYAFGGWSINPDGSGEVYEDETTILNLTAEDNGVVTLYVIWKKYHTVTFVTNGGNEIQPVRLPADSTINVEAPVRDGFTFDGWYADSNFDEPISVMPDRDITLYARWANIGLTFSWLGSGYAVTGGVTSGELWIPGYYDGYPVVEIGDYAFEETSITKVVMPDTITEAGWNVFKLCTSLESVRLSKNLNLGYAMFSYCYALKDITIPDTVTKLSAYVFQGCKSLEKIVIPISVVQIGQKTFNGCDNLTIYCEAESLPSGWQTDPYFGSWNYDNRPVYWGYRSFTIAFNSNGGSEVEPMEADNKTQITTLPTAQKEGYWLEGWYFDNGTWEQPLMADSFMDKIDVSKVITVYARWMPLNTITLTATEEAKLRP